MMLHVDEKIGTQKDFKSLIESSGQTGKLLRPVVSGSGSFDGPIETDEHVVIESFPMEWHPLAPEELKQLEFSGYAHVLPDLDIQENDIVEFETHRYRISDVRPEVFFGTLVYQTVQLEREYRG